MMVLFGIPLNLHRRPSLPLALLAPFQGSAHAIFLDPAEWKLMVHHIPQERTVPQGLRLDCPMVIVLHL